MCVLTAVTIYRSGAARTNRHYIRINITFHYAYYYIINDAHIYRTRYNNNATVLVKFGFSILKLKRRYTIQ